MTDTRDLTPGDRRELRSLVKKQFAVLRNDVKRREQELRGEVEGELLRRYRDQDERIKQAQQEIEEVSAEYQRACQRVIDALRSAEPNLQVGLAYGNRLAAKDDRRTQQHAALLAAIPVQVAAAQTKLDQAELDLLRDLTIGALDSDQAHQFLGRIPTVAALVPKARLAELDAGVDL